MTHEQKFVLLLENNNIFKEDLKYLQRIWNPLVLSNPEDNAKGYVTDLKYIIEEAGLPARFISLVHDYITFYDSKEIGIVDSEFVKRKPIRIKSNDNTGTILIEIDSDTSLNDMRDHWKNISKLQKSLLKFKGSNKITQESRQFSLIRKLLKNKKGVIGNLVANDMKAWEQSNTAETLQRSRNKLRVLKSRATKLIKYPKKLSLKDAKN